MQESKTEKLDIQEEWKGGCKEEMKKCGFQART